MSDIKFVKKIAPGAPGAGDVIVYVDVTTGKLASKDETNTVTDYGSGSSLSKATGAEVATGTDDAKFVTAKAIKDSVNVPNVVPGTDGNVLTAASGAWVSSAPSGSGGDVTGPATNTADYIPQWNGADSKKLKNGVALPAGGLAGLTSPSLTTPNIGVATATSINKVTVTTPATGSTLTIADGVTLTASANATISGTNTGDQTVPVKATGAEVATGTDDAKFVTAKAIKDSVNVPNVVPGTAGNVLTSTGSVWESSASAGGAVIPSLFERDTRLTGGAATSATTRRTLVVTPASSTIAVNIAGALRTIPASQSLDLDTAGNWDSATYATAANRAGKDFYLYACENGGAIAPLLILSANSTTPESGTTPRKIGGFHCLCVNVGTISGHTLTGYIVGDILPQSVWDLKWKPKNITPEGMVYSPTANIWVDIYLLNSSYTSTYATGAGALVSTNWMNFVDGAGSVGKRLLRDFEFQLIAAGSNEQTNITGSAWTASRGGHVDTASRRMISNIGCEDCAGLIWQWLDEQSYWYATPAEGWFTTEGSKGQMYLQSNRGDVKLLAGGVWNLGAYCGSRSRISGTSRWAVYEDLGSRGACE